MPPDVGGRRYGHPVNLLLLSLGLGAVPAFLGAHAAAGRLGYVRDAANPYPGAPFVAAERDAVQDLAGELVDVVLATTTAADLERALDGVDALYVAGGNTFALLHAIRSSGAERVLTDRVRSGLPYIGCSAGSIVAGPNIEPAALMDPPAEAQPLDDYSGLHLIDDVVIPHADGNLPPYPASLIEKTFSTYAHRYPLRALKDDQALLVTGDGVRLIAS